MANNFDALEKSLSALYRIELLQKMAMLSESGLSEYPISEYANLLNTVLADLKDGLTYLDTHRK